MTRRGRVSTLSAWHGGLALVFLAAFAGGAGCGRQNLDLAPDDDVGGQGGSSPDARGGQARYRALAVTTGEIHVCVLLDDHNVKCWGANGYGQLGYGDARSRGASSAEMGDALPVVDLGTGRTATAIAAGRFTTCAILDDGSLKCWGNGAMAGNGGGRDIGVATGQMGDHLAPLDFGGRKARHVAIGDFVACAAMDDDTVWCWGDGHPSVAPQRAGTGAPSIGVKDLGACGGGLFALYVDGTVGALPLADDGISGLVPAGHAAIAIGGAYSGTSCAVLDDGSATCLEGAAVETLRESTRIVGIGAQRSGADALLVTADGAVHYWDYCLQAPQANSYCAGGGDEIRLGQPAVAVTSGGEDFSCALLSDGGVKCWGGDTTMPPPTWSGAEVDVTESNVGVVYGAWHEVDLGTRPQ